MTSNQRGSAVTKRDNKINCNFLYEIHTFLSTYKVVKHTDPTWLRVLRCVREPTVARGGPEHGPRRATHGRVPATGHQLAELPGVARHWRLVASCRIICLFNAHLKMVS